MLNLTADFEITGDLIVTGGSLALNGHTLTVGRNLRVNTNTTINCAGTATLDVGGHCILSNGILDPSGGDVMIGGDLCLQTISEDGAGILSYTHSPGRLYMTEAGCSVLVGGDFVTDSRHSHSTYLTEGTLEVKGDFTQLSSYGNTPTPENFLAGSNHRVVLSGSSDQTVTFADPTRSQFETLEILNAHSGQVTFSTRVRVADVFDHHQRRFVLDPSAQTTDFSDSDGTRDQFDLFPDDATTATYTYEYWKNLHFWAGEADFAAVSAPLADPDRDVNLNITEFGRGTLPTIFDPPPGVLSIVDVGGASHLALTFTRVKSALGSVAIHKLGFTDRTTGWAALSWPTEEVLADDGEIETVRITDLEPLPANPTHLLRLAFEMLAP